MVYNSEALYKLVLLPWYQVYTYMMYFSVQMISTIGYGDITPKNPIECLFVILAFICQAVLWGYILS